MCQSANSIDSLYVKSRTVSFDSLYKKWLRHTELLVLRSKRFWCVDKFCSLFFHFQYGADHRNHEQRNAAQRPDGLHTIKTAGDGYEQGHKIKTHHGDPYRSSGLEQGYTKKHLNQQDGYQDAKHKQGQYTGK